MLWILAPLFLFNQVAEARPEYAAKEKLSCTTCHVAPWGGSGPRTIFGKDYGTHGLEGSLTTFSDVFLGDMRTVGFFPLRQTSQTTNGVATMEAAISGNLAIVKAPDQSETRAVLTYNTSPLAGSNLREAYIRYRPGSGETNATYWTIGHVNMPFGLLTDEHRTYTRIQTDMTLNNFDTGAVYSHDFHRAWHVDLAVVNDFQSGGSFNNNGLTYGTVANLQWNPVDIPFLFGASGTYQYTSLFPQPLAGSLYTVLSLDRLTKNKISASLSLETVLARNWNNPAVNNGGINPSLSTFFLGTAQSITPYLATTSWGNYALAKYWMNPHWYAFYKFDYFAIDTRHLGNDFIRHGIGSEIWVNPNVSISARVEFAFTPGLDTTQSYPSIASESDVFGYLRIWL